MHVEQHAVEDLFVRRFRATAAAIGGPVRFELIPGGKHQLMLFNTEVFSNLVEEWVAPILAG